ncbi:ATP synthase subunit O, mitochondrial [Bombus terrestris]|uniref:Oligomycin sensitivity conferral protein n=1 Tax=Bombus terrestris TaxID=30195 RepID=A0A9B0BLJ0_BOMTE|nr:ATP synthase subunit O, mitochondrial [Bombus terrestris]
MHLHIYVKQFTLYNDRSVEPHSSFSNLDTCCSKYMTMSFSRIIVRSLSSSSAAQQMVKPPIQVYGIEGRYATALYSAASKQKVLNNVEKDLLKFQDLLKKDKQLGEFVKNPSIKRKDKVKALQTIGGKVSLSNETVNLLGLLAENGRLSHVNNVINTFKLFMAANRGEVPCEVITAKPLDAEMTSKLQAALKGFLSKGQSILLTSKVDPSIIGGMIIAIGDKYVDMSVASKVKKYSDIIANTV